MNSEFTQKGPSLINQYDSDPWLKSLIKLWMPSDLVRVLEGDLHQFGERVVGEMLEWAWQAETHPPRHIPYSAWGERIDQIELSEGWKKLEAVAAEEGLIAIAYERKQQEFSRFYQFAKLYLYHPSSSFFSCPLAMTDGAARILEVMGDEKLKARALKHLTSRDPKSFWTSGQWMTEKTGGSDVSGTSTMARRVSHGFELSGIKWFTSSVTSQMAMALARIEGAPEGSKGLSLFYLDTYKHDGSLNNIEILRLKEKLGTRALPTAELRLLRAKGSLIGQEGRGVANIATMLNLTRMHNAICSVAHMRRSMVLARDYAEKRQSFGQPLTNHPTFVATMAQESEVLAGAMCSVFYASLLLGREEVGVASEREQGVLRLLIPLVKLATAKLCISQVSEMLEVIGGAGYVEDTRIPVLLRDAQVFPIWEGPTSVLSLDVLRVISKTSALDLFFEDIEERIARISECHLAQSKSDLIERVRGLKLWVKEKKKEGPEFWSYHARTLSWGLWRAHTASLLMEWSEFELKAGRKQIPLIAQRWVQRHLTSMSSCDSITLSESQEILS